MNQDKPSEAAHASSSSHNARAVRRRFYSSEPFLGADTRRHPVDSNGFEAIPGYQPIRAAMAIPPSLRAVSELTYSLPKAPLIAAAVAVPVVPTLVSDPTVYPWRVNAALKITVPGKSEMFLGTGWFIGPYAVVTAAHAVYPREPGGYMGWASRIEVIPGSDGFNKPGPFGTSVSSLFYCPDGWQSEGDPRLDYGVVILSDGLGSKVGSFGFATYADNDLLTVIANVAGYPVDPPVPAEPQGRLWYSAGAVTSVDDSFVYYSLGTQVGESGSCVYRNIGDQSYAIAVHTSASGMQDRGLRIIEPVYQNFQKWASMRG